MKRNLFLMLATMVLSALPLTAAEQLLNLPAVSTARFNINEYIAWPAEYGDAHVCLWNDDKYAAVTITIDDNIPGDHDWWLSMGDTYSLKFTWFVIVWPYMYDYDGSAGTNQGGFGTIDKFQRLFDAGHAVQGHGTCSINDLPLTGTEQDYQFTKQVLEDSIPGNRVLTYAYPCGEAKLAIAETMFIACRGVVGKPNEVAKVNYMNTNSTSLNDCWVNGIMGDGSSCTEGSWQANSIARYDRGWLSVHYHTVADRAALETELAKLYASADKLWAGTFPDVARYAQSRDSHTLTVTSVAASKITFTLSDRMHDGIFDFPLTVKVRVDSSWSGVTAVQNGTPVEASLVTNQENKYALVKAVPDAGEVTVTSGSTDIAVPVRTFNRNAVHGEIYDLRGKRVDVTRTGVYIVNVNGVMIKNMIVK